VVADGVVVGRIMKVHGAPVRALWMWTLAFGQHHAHTRLCSNARGGDGGIREKLAAGASFRQCRHASGGLGEAIPWTLLPPFIPIGAPFQ
jgi:hypothetical protein